MEEEFSNNSIQKALDNLPENINILEEQIDINTQMKYFEYSKKIRKKELLNEFFEAREELFSSTVSTKRKKKILSVIAGMDDIAAFRTIERFIQYEKGELKQWGILAYQESRMLIQSSLLDEQQVFISTGLGGKGQSLRYFAVFINREGDKVLDKTQKKLLKNELIFEIEKSEGEFENIRFIEGFSTVKVLLPIKANIKQVFRDVIDECNQYGNFLEEDMIVTNVKELTREEIIEVLEQNINDNHDELEEEND